MTTYEMVKNQSTEEYFNGNQFSIDAFNKKYCTHEGETYVQAIKRVCDYIASAEDTLEKQRYWSERWFDEIYNDWWHPAGSIMQSAATGKKISLFNCTTISLGTGREHEEWDNLESILKNTAYTVAKAAAYRQGLGIHYSRLRPVGTKVLNSANESTGSIHWMKFYDSLGYFVGQKGRIPAMLFSQSCDHPDIVDFVKVKASRDVIQNANISVQCTNKFYDAIYADGDWELLFEIPDVKKGDKVYVDVNSKDEDCLYDQKKKQWYYVARKNRPYEKISKTLRAKELMELIAQNMCAHAEPGIQNIDIARKYSNSDYVYDLNDEYDSRIVSTNACSEQYLSKDSCCVLSSINAGKFSTNLDVLTDELRKIGYSINRFLDNVNEMELRDGTYVTPHQKLAIQKLRRTGAGFTNIAAWLFKNNLEYGSPEGNAAIENFADIYNLFLYKSSIELGKEKGSFGLFKREKYEKSPFIKRMMKKGLVFETMRNCTCSSIAPTGTLSLMFRDAIFSYGIEPAFYMYFWKRTRISGKYEYYFCVPSVVREYFAQNGIQIPMKGDSIKDTWDGKYGLPIAKFIEEKAKELNIKFRKSTEIKPLDKLDLMAKVMKWVDSSISVTYMLPEGSNWHDVYDFILEAHKREVKSIAAFPDKKMYGIVSFIPFYDLAVKLTKEDIKITEENFSKEEIEELEKCCNARLIPSDKIQKSSAPKRPKILNCDVHHVKVVKHLDKKRTFDYIVIVGLYGEDPYEMFVMENGFIDKKVSRGTLTKAKRGVYTLSLEDGTVVEDITQNTTESEDIFTRMVSMNLRHGVDIAYIVDQLEKSEGDLWSFGKAMSRTLKKYIKNGVKVTGSNCPQCGSSNLIRIDGCATCTCGYSKCS